MRWSSRRVNAMLNLLVGESNDHIAITDERDCLPSDVIRVNERIFVDDKQVIDCARSYERRGFKVSVQYGEVEYFGRERLL
jgi:hypothetical protein